MGENTVDCRPEYRLSISRIDRSVPIGIFASELRPDNTADYPYSPLRDFRRFKERSLLEGIRENGF